jgi:uncharacterized protein (TIGR02145 family)
MKAIWTLVLILFFSFNFAQAQDTLYVYKAGVVITKHAVNDIDSITFYKNYNLPVQPTITDKDGNTYHTVIIGKQTWMVENLKTTLYNDGSPISFITDGYQWSGTTMPGYCWYNNDITANKNVYGALYNWYVVNTGKLAPVGWHIPSQAEINALTTFLGGNQIAASKVKESGNVHWSSSNGDATNSSGFTALPGGYRSSASGDYHNAGIWGVFWSSDDINGNGGRYMMSNTSTILDYNSDGKMCGFSVRCIKDTIALPTLATVPAINITDTSAIVGGNITTDGGATITSRGLCWGTTVIPTINNNKTTNGTGTGAFTGTITGLKADSIYYVRAYATNSVGTVYGTQISFKTLNPAAQNVTDIDGNVYHTINIGKQTWMVENLKTTRLNDSTSVALTTNSNQWINATTPGYCWVNNDLNNKNTYGALYNFYAASSAKLAPKGWHVPTQAEVNTLISYLGGFQLAGSALKESGNVHWYSSNTDATNSSCFTALPAGYRSSASGDFHNSGSWGIFWSSTEINGMGGRLMLEDTLINTDYSPDAKVEGFSIRCIKN